MGSYMNFKNFGGTPEPDFPMANFPLVRQSSVYSLTFDELQNTFSGVGKDFGSMNMDELLKNIWSAEETQSMASSATKQGTVPPLNLQKQGSLTLPRTLSQKTVDEVWRDLFKESKGLNDGSRNTGAELQQRQTTLGEMTLEEFLSRAGVVGEPTQPTGRPNNSAVYGEFTQPSSNSSSLTFGFQQPARSNTSNQITGTNKAVPFSFSSAMNVIQSSQPSVPQLQPLFPKQATVAFASPMHLANNGQLASPTIRGPVFGNGDLSVKTDLVQGGILPCGVTQTAGLSNGAAKVTAGSPPNQLTPIVIPKGNLDTSSSSPSPLAFNEGLRGKKSGDTLEKVVERRRRRMIKNRESAERSRARKLAYTLELEEEVAKLKEVNEELQRKQEEFMEMQKNQMENIKLPWGGKRVSLRRTLTGPW